MADGPRDEHGSRTNKIKNIYGTMCGDNKNSELKTNNNKISDNQRVKLSFYVEREPSELSIENSSDDKNCVISNGAEDFINRSDQITSEVERSVADGRRKRCIDRYDSSESSDSGVAVLSSTDSGGCGGSDITEPGSPYSPASSSGNSDDSAAARLPTWACEPPPSAARNSSVARKRHNLELIADRLQPKRVACQNNNRPVAAIAPKTNKSQQGRITEYYNHKMKPHATLKRDPSASHKVDDKKKLTPKNNLSKDLQKYISYLSQTLDTKVLPDSTQDKERNLITEQIPNTTKTENTFTNLMNKIGTSGIIDNNTTDKFPNISLSSNTMKVFPSSKKEEKFTKKNSNPKRPIRRMSTTNKGKIETAKVTGTVRWPSVPPQIAAKPDIPVVAIQPLTDKNVSNFESNKLNICNNMVQTQIPYNHNYNKLHTSYTSQETPSPSCTNITSQCNATISNTSNLAPFVAIPQTVMLTTLRIPQNNNAPQPINPNSVNGLNRPNMTMGTPNKLNGQFVFPLMQNINGTVVQIPNMMTKVAQNYVIPNTAHLQQRQDNGMQAQQTTQMLINGALYKLATPTMQTNFSNVVTKSPQQTSVAYPVMSKTFNTGVPTVVVSKPNYTINMGHPVYMPQSGFIFNSVPNVKMCENQTLINPTLTNTVTNLNLAHLPDKLQNDNVFSTTSIPIAPVKPPDRSIHTLADVDIQTIPPTFVSSIVTEQHNVSSSYSLCDIRTTEPVNYQECSENIIYKEISTHYTGIYHNTDEGINQNTEVKTCLRDSVNVVDTSCDDAVISMDLVKQSDLVFTDITVSKDVSSELQRTIMERTCSSMTNDSSESGIGTDKSIDSPTDSRTSKEGDDDFMSSISVSVNSSAIESCQKSPILKEPKTIRFPPRVPIKDKTKHKTAKDSSASIRTVCLWENCKNSFENDSFLLEHLQIAHVNSQAGRENFVCQWEGCKVQGKTSSSKVWLERHTLSHGGNKPFKCIVEDCGKRFSTQLLLERHVNNHFVNQNQNVSSTKKSQESGPKHIRRNGKKVRYRRTPWSARRRDFVDAGIVQGISYRLHMSTIWRLSDDCFLEDKPPHTIKLTSRILASRTNEGKKEMLLSWTPPNVMDDDWVLESEVKSTCRVKIADLPVQKKLLVYEQFCSSYRDPFLSSSSREGGDKGIEKEKTHKVSGAMKRKQGRSNGGNFFWPSGR